VITTVDASLERVRRNAMLGSYGPFYMLMAPATDSDTMLTLDHEVAHITLGSILAVDYELMRVTAIAHGSNTLEVQRGFLGTTPAAHDEMALVEQDPRYPKAVLLDHAEQEVRSWEKQLFRIVTLPITTTRSERTYDLVGVAAEGIDFLLEVRAPPVNVPIDDFGSTWSGDTWPKVEAKLLRNMPVADLPSGFGLQLKHWPREAGTLRVAYASPFTLTAWTGATDLVATVGLDPGWIEILEHGVRARALTGSMSSRSDWRATGTNRDAQEVNLLDLVRAVDMAQAVRDRRLTDAATKLRSRYPYREGY
jgi:hypothetical protein